MQSYLTCIICFSRLKHLFATVKRHSVGVFPCFATTFLQLAYFLLRPRHSIAMAERDYPEIPLERTGNRAGYSGCGGNVSPTRRAEDEWSTEYQTLSKKAHTKGLFFFSPTHKRAVRSYQTPSSRVDGGPFSCLIYSDKSSHGNGL